TDRLKDVCAFLEFDQPAQPGRWKLLAVSLPHLNRSTVHEEFHGGAVRVDLYQLQFVRVAPTNWPRVSVNMDHWLFGPILLEHKVTFLKCHISFHQSFLITARNRIART